VAGCYRNDRPDAPEYATKGKNSKKETKTPKQEKPKVHATANSQGGEPAVSISGKKVK